MALVSPGLSVTVTDESQYISNAVGTVPLVVMATAQDKTLNGAVCSGTTKANAGQLQIFGSQRDLSTAMGYPIFQQSSAGTPLHGDETNEYGLMAAYSALGLGNQLYAIRADVDLNQLEGTSVRPTGTVADGTYWFDLADTTWGIYEWSASSQSFTAQTPLIITSSSQCVSTTQGSLTNVYAPLTSFGAIGDYAVVTRVSSSIGDYSNRVFYKAGNNNGDGNINGLRNTWVLLGTPNFHKSHPTVVAATTNPSVVAGNLAINGNVVTVSGSPTIANVVSAINAASITGVSADTINGALALYSDSTSTANTSGDGAIKIATSGNATALLNSLGLSTGTYNCPDISFGSFANAPYWNSTDATATPNGSVWIKTSTTGGGLNYVVKRYNALTNLWNSVATPVYINEQSALGGLDPTGGGINIPLGTIYVLQDPSIGASKLEFAGFKLKIRDVVGQISATGSVVSSTAFTNGSTFKLQVTLLGNNVSSSVTVTLGGTGPADFVTAVLNANLPYLDANVNSNGSITLTHLLGGDINMTQISGQPNIPSQAGFASGIANVYTTGNITYISGFKSLASLPYAFSTAEPVADPANGTLWYYSDPTVIDVMINDGTNWRGYQTGVTDARGYSLAYGTLDPNGVIAAAIAPTTQTDNTSLQPGDLWLNTSDLENWPNLNRWNGSLWVNLDNTDHISQNGVIFADARWDTSGTTDPISDNETPVAGIASGGSLITSNYLDLDAPNPALYPRGMLLVNTRRSGYNVKRYVANYFVDTSFATNNWSSSTSYSYGAKALYGSTIYVSTIAGTNTNTNNSPTSGTGWAILQQASWVTDSGLKADGTPYAGHSAQRAIVVAAMNAAIEANTEIREEQFSFQLICAPGYPELIPNMVSLNNDRTNTAFVIGDTPLGLSTNVVDINNWSNDTNGDGLATNDPYLAVYYPSGLSTDLGGNAIMVPPSHMALRTYMYNDNVSYPWFAPAGTRRGLVNNATDLGYLDYTTGEFVRTGVNQGLRDALYQLKINPITILPGIGLVVWGQKTRDPNTESMDRVNVARLVNYLRTIFAGAGNAFLFEPNDKITRDQFAAQLNSALNDLVAKRGIYDYLVVCDTSNNTPDIIANNELYADVAIEPEKAVEFIYIPIRLYNPGQIAKLGSQ
jgi:hypothetical protein